MGPRVPAALPERKCAALHSFLPREAGEGNRPKGGGGGDGGDVCDVRSRTCPYRQAELATSPACGGGQTKNHSRTAFPPAPLKQPQPFRAFQRADIQKLLQRPAGRVRLCPFGRLHRALAVPVTGVGKEAPSRPAAARLRAIAPVFQQRALRLGQIAIPVAVRQPLHRADHRTGRGDARDCRRPGRRF
jgi:hypothetical protein